MNRSWKNTSNNSSTGFVYFNTNKSIQKSPNNQNSLDTSEFLSFRSDSSPAGSPHGNHFSPSNYSSPKNHYYAKSPRQRGGRNQYWSPIKQSGGKFQRKNIGQTGPAESNARFTKSYHTFSDNQHSQNRYHFTNRQNFHQNAPNQSFNSSTFYDPSCLQDPWAELEQKLVEDRKKEEIDSLPKPDSGLPMDQIMDVEAEEASSDERESEDESEEMEESYS